MKLVLKIILGLLLTVIAAFIYFVMANRYVAPQEGNKRTFNQAAPAADDLSGTSYGGDPGQSRHSTISQITPENVAHLQVAWIYRTGEIQRRGKWSKQGKFQNTPIIAAGNLILCTPFSRVVALDNRTRALGL